MHAQGWSEQQADAMRSLAREEIVAADPMAIIFSHEKKFSPTGHVKLHTPPLLEKPLVQACRATAARVFQVGVFWFHLDANLVACAPRWFERFLLVQLCHAHVHRLSLRLRD